MTTRTTRGHKAAQLEDEVATKQLRSVADRKNNEDPQSPYHIDQDDGTTDLTKQHT